MIYSSHIYEQNELPPEFTVKLEQAIVKLGFVAQSEHESLKTLFEEQTTELIDTKSELFDIKDKNAELAEINENLIHENKDLKVKVNELQDINENLRRIPQKEMVGLAPATPKLSEIGEQKPQTPKRNDNER
jgi:arginine deiminase